MVSPAHLLRSAAILNEEFAKNFDNLQLEATVSNNVLLADQTPCCGRPMSTTSASLSDINVDITTVRLALAQLRDSAAGPDNLSPIFFKHLAY